MILNDFYNHHHLQTSTNKQLNHQNKLFDGDHKKRYSCDQCSYSTDRRDLYRRHENIHKDEKPFRCYVCNKMFNRADHVKKHFLRIHKGLEYNVKLIKRSNGVDCSSSSPSSSLTTTENNQNNDSHLNGHLISSDNVINDYPSGNSTNGLNCLTNLMSKPDYGSLLNSYGSQTVFPKFKSLINPPTNQSHQRSLLTNYKPQSTEKSSLQLNLSQSNQRSLLTKPNLLSSAKSLQSMEPIVTHQSSQSQPQLTSSLISSLSSLSSSPSSSSTHNTNIDSDDDTTITTINSNNQIIIVICGKQNSNHKSIINHMLNHNDLKRSRKYPSQCPSRSSTSSLTSCSSLTRKDRRKQSKPKRATIERS